MTPSTPASTLTAEKPRCWLVNGYVCFTEDRARDEASLFDGEPIPLYDHPASTPPAIPVSAEVEIAAIRHTLMTGLSHNAAIAELDRLSTPAAVEVSEPDHLDEPLRELEKLLDIMKDDDDEEALDRQAEVVRASVSRSAAAIAIKQAATPPEAAASVQGPTLAHLTRMAYELRLVPEGEMVPVQLLDVLRDQFNAAMKIATPVVQGEPVAVSDQRIRDEITRVSGYQWWEIDAVEVVSSRRMMLIARALLDMPTSGERDL